MQALHPLRISADNPRVAVTNRVQSTAAGAAISGSASTVATSNECTVTVIPRIQVPALDVDRRLKGKRQIYRMAGFVARLRGMRREARGESNKADPLILGNAGAS